MAKKWGKRKKANPVVVSGALGSDAVFGMPQPPRQAPPASSTPLADYLSQGRPGVDEGYVVLPRSLAEEMPLPWQQQMASLLARFHDAHAGVSWPAYRVVPSRPERLVDLDEEQLAEAGYLVEIDVDGEMVYRERNGRKVTDPQETVVLVPCLDPIVRERDTADGGAEQPRRAPAPMNIGPQPVWRTTTPPRTAADAPPLPSPPTAPSAPPAPQAPSAQPAPHPEPARSLRPDPPSRGLPEVPTSLWVPPVAAAPTSASETPPAQTPEPSGGPVSSGAGTVRERDWFDELTEAGTGEPGAFAGPSASDAAPGDAAPGNTAPEDTAPGDGEFGPTGDEPTEIPYRYRR